MGSSNPKNFPGEHTPRPHQKLAPLPFIIINIIRGYYELDCDFSFVIKRQSASQVLFFQFPNKIKVVCSSTVVTILVSEQN